MIPPCLKRLQALLTSEFDTVELGGIDNETFIVTFYASRDVRAIKLYLAPTMVETLKGFMKGPWTLTVASNSGIPSNGFMPYLDAYTRAQAFTVACFLEGYAALDSLS